MINLLPPAIKEDYRYGLRNSSLLRWVSACLVALVGLGLIATYGLLTMQKSNDDYANKVSVATADLNKQNLKGTEAQVKEITTDFKLVVQVLSKEVLFSKLLNQIATVIPSKAILTNLEISQTAGAIDITAATADYTTATQVQLNLQDPANKIFSKADIISIACAASPVNPKYPCTIQVRALFAQSNPYLFINTKGS
jgi:Tfp pilus assembly protein PilN